MIKNISMQFSCLTIILHDQVSEASAGVQLAVTGIVNFMLSDYLSDDSAYFKNFHQWDFYSAILNGVHDCTNNTSESINKKFKYELKSGYKSFSKVALSIYKNKKDYIGLYKEKVGADRMRKRPPQLRKKMDERQKIIQDFDLMTNNDQYRYYATFLQNIKKQL